MRTSLVLAAIVLAFPAAGARIELFAQDAELQRRLRAAIAQEAAAGFSGSVVVVHRGRTLVEGGFGTIKGVAMQPETRYWIASLGKQFTAAAVLRAQDQGCLRLDDPIARHLRGVPPGKAAITIRQLLSHTSGLPQAYVSEAAETREAATKAILDLPLAAKPGERFMYSNENFQLAAVVIELVSKRAYWDFVRDELLLPAGLSNTGVVRGDKASHIAPTIAPLPARLTKRTWGQQGYFSTAPDLAHWYQALQTDQILSRGARDAMFAPTAPIQEGAAALGWFITRTADGRAVRFTRGNEDFGANGLIYGYPDVNGVIVVLSHAGNQTPDLSYSRAMHARLEAILTR